VTRLVVLLNADSPIDLRQMGDGMERGTWELCFKYRAALLLH
jgi:hypothetical protein